MDESLAGGTTSVQDQRQLIDSEIRWFVDMSENRYELRRKDGRTPQGD